jgi:hypothetical protein
VRLFHNPRVRRYFRNERLQYLEFGDIQYLLCNKKPRRDKWRTRWKEYFPQLKRPSRKTGLEAYNSKEHVYQEIRKIQQYFPDLLVHNGDKGYRLSPDVKKNVTKEYLVSRLSEYPTVADLYDVSYFGLDLDYLEERQRKDLEKKVHKSLERVLSIRRVIRELWTHQCLNEFVDRLSTLWNEIDEEDNGFFLGYVLDHMDWFVRVCDQEKSAFKNRNRLSRSLEGQLVKEHWRNAKRYGKNIGRILQAHGSDIGTYVQNQRLKSTIKVSHFQVVDKAIGCMVRDGVLSNRDAKWLRIQQRMSELYAKELGGYLSFDVAERSPIVIIDTGLA